MNRQELRRHKIDCAAFYVEMLFSRLALMLSVLFSADWG